MMRSSLAQLLQQKGTVCGHADGVPSLDLDGERRFRHYAATSTANVEGHSNASAKRSHFFKKSKEKPVPAAFCPSSVEVELQRQHLIQLAYELDRLSESSTEANTEKELLVAERSLIILSLEAATRALTSGTPMTKIDLETCELESRIAALRCKLPPTSSARLLTERSDLLPSLKGLRQQLLNLQDVWNEEAARVEQARLGFEDALRGKDSELQNCQRVLQDCHRELQDARAEHLSASHEKQEEAAGAEGLRKQLLEAKVLFARLQEEAQSDARCLAHTAADLREQLLNAQASMASLQTELEQERSCTRAAASKLQHKQQLLQEQQLDREQVLQEDWRQKAASLKAALSAAHMHQHKELQQRVNGLELKIQEAVARAEQAEARHLATLQQNQELRLQAAKATDQLTTENTKLREDNQTLEVIVLEAEKQLHLVQKDLDGVKRQQHRANQERQRQLEALAMRGLAADFIRPPSSPSPPRSPHQRRRAAGSKKPWILI